MATLNVTIKKYNGTDWDIIYPKTLAENIVSGTFDPDRIPNLDASKIQGGTLADNLIPNLDAGKITTGVISASRLPAIAITNVTTDTTWENFAILYAPNKSNFQEGDILILTTDNKTYIHNGGQQGTIADFNLLATPTDAVSSVAGKKGNVTLVKGDVGLDNVDNTSDANKPISTATQTALNNKVTANAAITGATKAKISYDSKGLVTGGTDLSVGDIPSIPTSKVSGLDTILSGKQTAVSIITSATIPNPTDGWKTGDIIFHIV